MSEGIIKKRKRQLREIRETEEGLFGGTHRGKGTGVKKKKINPDKKEKKGFLGLF